MKYHLMLLEEKRRQKINRQFRELSVMLPGLTKMDKSCVLEECIKYIKDMEQRVKELEEKAAKKANTEDESSTTSAAGFSSHDDGLFEIETGVSDDRNVLIRINCENRKGVMVKFLDEIEKRELSVVNSSFMSFGPSTIAITVVAKMGNESLDVRELVNGLRVSFAQQ